MERPCCRDQAEFKDSEGDDGRERRHVVEICGHEQDRWRLSLGAIETKQEASSSPPEFGF